MTDVKDFTTLRGCVLQMRGNRRLATFLAWRARQIHARLMGLSPVNGGDDGGPDPEISLPALYAESDEIREALDRLGNDLDGLQEALGQVE